MGRWGSREKQHPKLVRRQNVSEAYFPLNIKSVFCILVQMCPCLF